jgi:CSLREA domain-containing protein
MADGGRIAARRGGATWPRVASAIALLMAAFALSPGAANAATITVNSIGDADADDSECTLREAILAANENVASGASAGECGAGDPLPTVDTIDFLIAGGGPHVIAPATRLPEPHESMTIDGGLTDPNAIVIDGVNVPTEYGLSLQAPGGHTVRRLAIVNFDEGIETGFSAPGNTIEQNRIGTNFGSDPGLGNDDGIRLNGDASTVRANVISGNSTGIFIFTGEGNEIVGNRIGTDFAGTSALANGVGISTQSDADNVIGGATAADENVISGNTGAGIATTSTEDLRVVGNLIGTDITGTADLGNGGAGVRLSGSSADAGVIGAPGEGNVISGNATSGVEIRASGASIDGNRIGTNEAGDAAIPNGAFGVLVADDDTRVGSSSQGNVIAGQDGIADAGILVDSTTSLSGLVIERNRVGTSADGLSALPNLDGVKVEGSTEGARIVDNLVSGNAGDGIELNADPLRTVTGTVIQANQIGNALDGGSLGNGGHALNVVEADATLVGGAPSAEANALNSSGGDGVSIGPDASATAVLGNHINENDELGVDIQGGVEDGFGVTANDGPDEPDGLQNFPVLDAALAGGSTHVTGRLESEAGTDFRIEVFASPTGDPSGHGEGRDPLGSFDVTTDGGGSVSFAATVAGTPVGARYEISATATELDAGGDPLSTSEFALNEIEGCDQSGTAGAETLTADGTGQALCGEGGEDTLAGAAGGDVLDGGAGIDTAEYSGAGGPVSADLAAGRAGDDGDGAKDVLSAVESLVGSAFPDTLKGDGGANALTGAPGADRLIAGNGNDAIDAADGEADALIDCGPGNDTVDADNSSIDPDAIYVGCETINRPAAPGGGGGGALPAPAPDTTAPVLTLSGKKKQKSKSKLKVDATCDEACAVEAGGTIKVPKGGKKKRFSLRDAGAELAAGETATLKLKLKGKARKLVGTALKQGRKSTARLTAIATDAAGNESAGQKHKVKVERKKR